MGIELRVERCEKKGRKGNHGEKGGRILGWEKPGWQLVLGAGAGGWDGSGWLVLGSVFGCGLLARGAEVASRCSVTNF